MKTTVKVLAASAGLALCLFFIYSMVPVAGVLWEISQFGTIRMMLILEMIVLPLIILVFELLKKKDPEIRSVKDLIREERAKGTAVLDPKKPSGACYQPVRFGTVLLWIGAMCFIKTMVSGLASEMGDASETISAAEIDMEATAVYLFLIVIVGPLTQGILFQGVLQRNLMKYGTVYAVLVSGAAYALFVGYMSIDGEELAFLLFFGYVAARYGFSHSLVLHMLYALFSILPEMLPIRFVLPGKSFVYTSASILDTFALYVSYLYVVWLVVKYIRFAWHAKEQLEWMRQLKNRVWQTADGVKTVLFFSGYYVLGKLATGLASLVYRINL